MFPKGRWTNKRMHVKVPDIKLVGIEGADIDLIKTTICWSRKSKMGEGGTMLSESGGYSRGVHVCVRAVAVLAPRFKATSNSGKARRRSPYASKVDRSLL